MKSITVAFLSLAITAFADSTEAPVAMKPLHTLTAAVPQSSSAFGYSVAADGNLVVVGARNEETKFKEAGRAYAFQAESGKLLHKLEKPAPHDYDRFGVSVAISGSRVAVGMHSKTNGKNTSVEVNIYEMNSATPTVPVITLRTPAPETIDLFGHSVGISGTRVVVGAYLARHDTNTLHGGAAYVFDLASETPAVPTATLRHPKRNAFANFGQAVAISGTRVVVGATIDDDERADGAGKAYVFDVNSASPTVPIAILDNPTKFGWDQFGSSVSISGTRVVVGAPQDFTGAAWGGSAHVYNMSNATPATPIARLYSPAAARDGGFGRSVAVFESRVLVGSPLSDLGAKDAGCAYLYDMTAANPLLTVASMRSPTPKEDTGFGSAVAIAGPRLVIGAVPKSKILGGSIADRPGVPMAGSAYLFHLSAAPMR